MSKIFCTIVTGASSLALALTLSACGGTDTGTTATTAETTAQVETASSTEAEIDPSTVHPGYITDEDNIAGTSDMWYATDGAKDALYLTHAGNDAGRTVTFVDADGGEDSLWDLEVKDGHLKNSEGASTDDRAVDITFQDAFTCYDAATGTHYLRGMRTVADNDALFAGASFVLDRDDPDKRRYDFADDGTVILTTDGKEIAGTWTSAAINLVVIHFASDTSE